MARLINRHTDSVSALTFDPQSSVLATGAHDGSIMFWQVPSGKAVGPTLGSLKQRVKDMIHSGDGRSLLVRYAGEGHNADLLLWDLKSGQATTIPAFRELDYFSEIALNDRADMILAGGTAGLAAINVTTHQQWRPVLNETVNSKVIAPRFVSDRRVSFVWETQEHPIDRTVRAGLWDITSGEVRFGPAIILENDELDGSVDVSPDGTYFLVRRFSGSLLWHIASGLRLERVKLTSRLPGGGDSTDRGPASFDRHNRLVAVSGGGVVDLAADRAMKSLNWGDAYGSLAALSPDGRWLAVFRKGIIELMDLRVGGTATTQISLGPDCSQTGSEGACLQPLCEKVSGTVTDDSLRDLLGSSAERIKAALRDAPCPSW